jgi:hypothetical protein
VRLIFTGKDFPFENKMFVRKTIRRKLFTRTAHRGWMRCIPDHQSVRGECSDAIYLSTPGLVWFSSLLIRSRWQLGSQPSVQCMPCRRGCAIAESAPGSKPPKHSAERKELIVTWHWLNSFNWSFPAQFSTTDEPVSSVVKTASAFYSKTLSTWTLSEFFLSQTNFINVFVLHYEHSAV